MKSRFKRVGAVTVAAGMGLGVLAPAALAADEDYKILVVGETMGFRHSHIPYTTEALIELGEEHGFTVDVWDSEQPELTLDSTPFTSAEDLSQYASLVFASPVDGTNDLDPDTPTLLDDDELEALQGYIHGGGGFVAIHAATDTMHTVPWYGELTGGGARFVHHPEPQQATMVVENGAHPSTAMLPTEWSTFDEWYSYSTNPREDVHVLMTLDESTYEPGSGAMGEDHPIAWCHNFEGGRSFQTGAFHVDETWSDPLVREHVLNGIEWTAGLVSGGGDCVTFPEVDGILDDASDADPDLAAQVSDLLASAKSAADADDHEGAVATLLEAQDAASGLGDDVLDTKIADLVVWQRALGDDASDTGEIPIDVSISDEPGVLTLTVADHGDGVQLAREDGPTDRWRYTGELPTVTVTDSRSEAQAGGGGWVASGQSSDFASESDAISADHFGWAPEVLTSRAGLAAGAETATALDGGSGMSVPAALATATADGRLGVAELGADLALDAPIGAAAGEYSASVTVSLFPVD